MSKLLLPLMSGCVLLAGTIASQAQTISAEACEYAKQHQLQIIHSSDNESSFQDPNTLEEKILGYSAVVSGLQTLAEDACIPSLHVTAGDHTIPGPFYQAATEVAEFGQPGLADIAMFGAMGLKGNGIGNHEFDGGINEFANMLAMSDYPFIAVNLDFTEVSLEEGTPEIRIGEDATNCAANAGKIVKSCFVDLGSTKVGLIGRAPAGFFEVIEDPETTLPGVDFIGGRDKSTNRPLVSAVGQVQTQIDKLESIGVNRIILLDHAQDFTSDPLQSQKLKGVDVIASAGSTGFFANPESNGPFNFLRPEDRLTGDDPAYPIIQKDVDGNTVLVVNTEQLYRYVGNLMVTFDETGKIIGYDDNRSGPIATSPEAVALFKKGADANPRVIEILDELQNTPIIQNSFGVIGSTANEMNGQRVDVRTRETNLGRLAADSTLWYVRNELGQPVDVALKNGGGIRDTITGPNVIRLTVEAALAFDNKLTVLELTGDQMLAVMENSVSRVPAADGRFPQIAGIRLDYDASQPGVENQESVTEPSRVRNLVVTRADGTDVTLVADGVAQNLDQSFVLATNSFTATGGDGYAAFAVAKVVNSTDVGEQQILEDYIVKALDGAVDLIDPPADARVTRLDSDS